MNEVKKTNLGHWISLAMLVRFEGEYSTADCFREQTVLGTNINLRRSLSEREMEYFKYLCMFCEDKLLLNETKLDQKWKVLLYIGFYSTEGQITDFFLVHIPQNHKKNYKNHRKITKITRKIM